MREQVEASRESFTPCSVREFSRKMLPCLKLDSPQTNLSTQHPLNKRRHVLVSHLNWNLVTVFRINNCPRVSAMSVDDLRHMPCLVSIGAVILAAVQNQCFRFYVLGIVEQ